MSSNESRLLYGASMIGNIAWVVYILIALIYHGDPRRLIYDPNYVVPHRGFTVVQAGHCVTQ